MAGAGDMSGARWQETASWIIPAAENAKAIAQIASRFSSEINCLKNKSRSDILGLPECNDSSVKNKMEDFCNSMDDASNSGKSIETSCVTLLMEWTKFKNHSDTESKKQNPLESKGTEDILQKLGKLLTLCSKCGEDYEVASERLRTAINACSILSDAFANKAREAAVEKSKKDSDADFAAGMTLITGAATVFLTAATAGAAAPLVAGVGGAATGSLGAVAGILWCESKNLREMAKNFDSARGMLQTTLGELNTLSGKISELEEQTRHMARNIKVGQDYQNRVKNTLDAKDREIALLRSQHKKNEEAKQNEQQNEMLRNQIQLQKENESLRKQLQEFKDAEQLKNLKNAEREIELLKKKLKEKTIHD